MKEIEFDVELTVKELYAFSMRHTYRGVSGIFGLVISLGCWVICALRFAALDNTARLALFIIGCLFTIVQPLMLYSKARAQIRQNKNINASLHYCLAEEGITVSQGEQEAFVKWYDVRRMVRTPKALYLYMSPVRAFIFPQEQCGGQYEEIGRVVAEKLEQYKDYAGEAEGSGADVEEPERKD